MKKKRNPSGNTRKGHYARLKVGNGERNRKIIAMLDSKPRHEHQKSRAEYISEVRKCE